VLPLGTLCLHALLHALSDEGDQFVSRSKAHGLAGVHVLDASLEYSAAGIDIGPDLNDEIANHTGFRIDLNLGLSR
jgi:hypothetical protein